MGFGSVRASLSAVKLGVSGRRSSRIRVLVRCAHPTFFLERKKPAFGRLLGWHEARRIPEAFHLNQRKYIACTLWVHVGYILRRGKVFFWRWACLGAACAAAWARGEDLAFMGRRQGIKRLIHNLVFPSAPLFRQHKPNSLFPGFKIHRIPADQGCESLLDRFGWEFSSFDKLGNG